MTLNQIQAPPSPLDAAQPRGILLALLPCDDAQQTVFNGGSRPLTLVSVRWVLPQSVDRLVVACAWRLQAGEHKAAVAFLDANSNPLVQNVVSCRCDNPQLHTTLHVFERLAFPAAGDYLLAAGLDELLAGQVLIFVE